VRPFFLFLVSSAACAPVYNPRVSAVPELLSLRLGSATLHGEKDRFWPLDVIRVIRNVSGDSPVRVIRDSGFWFSSVLLRVLCASVVNLSFYFDLAALWSLFFETGFAFSPA